MTQRENKFASHQGDHFISKNSKMTYATYEPDTKYIEELSRVDEMLKGLRTTYYNDNFDEYYQALDFSNYPHDLSQIDHDFIFAEYNKHIKF